MYMDVHVMVFVGFGFLMVFLKSYSWSAVGMNYVIAAWSLLVCILTGAFWHQVMKEYPRSGIPFDKEPVDLKTLIFLSEFGSAAVLITFGALLGKCNFFQLWCLATIEVCFYSLNEAIIINVFYAIDVGGAMTIH